METATANPVTATSVTAVPAAPPEIALAHFAGRLAVETDVADVAAALAAGQRDFTIVDARSRDSYDAGHLPGAVHLHHSRITPKSVEALPDALIVAYCWGPSCNAASKAGRRLAELGRPVKEMIGGFDHWLRDGHPVERSSSSRSRPAPHGRACGPP